MPALGVRRDRGSEASFNLWEASWVRARGRPTLPSASPLQLLLPELTWLRQGAVGGGTWEMSLPSSLTTSSPSELAPR